MGRIGVTVLGGYLGAGKTTVVNHVLATAEEAIAVLVNDFGDVDIDADLIRSRHDDTIELANGCICCSLVDGLASALDTIRDRSPAPDRLLIEASGVADPATVAAYGHQAPFVLDRVAVVVDAGSIVTRADDRYVGDTVRAQLRSADLLVVNKIDLVAPADLGPLDRWLADQAGGATVVHCRQGRVPLDVLSSPTSTVGPEPGHDRVHDEVFQSWTVEVDEPIERATVEELLSDLPPAVHRLKGIVPLADAPDRRTVIQAVGSRWELTDDGPWLTAEPGSIVAIGTRGELPDGWLADRLGRPGVSR